MELVLNQQEVEKILFDWANHFIEGVGFDAVTFDCGYSTLRKVTLGKEEPQDEAQ
jgi:hypothetical protein